jgi:hypothetical protein
MTDFTRLRFLLEHIHSYENCSQILVETYNRFGESEGWFFQKLHQLILSLIDDPDTFYGVSEKNPVQCLKRLHWLAFTA